jgi:hypothetical protein
MSDFDDLKTMIRRNKLLGMWAAEKLGLTGQEAEKYSATMAMDSLDAESANVFNKVRSDFHKSGVALSDEQILEVMNELMLEAAKEPHSHGAALDSAAVMLARNLTKR